MLRLPLALIDESLSLEPKQAQQLVRKAARRGLSLPRLRSLDPPTAEILNRSRIQLLLDGLDDLSPETASVLRHRRLSLGGLRALSLETARQLSHRITPIGYNINRVRPVLRVLKLNGLLSLDPEVARLIIDEYQPLDLALDGLTTISEQTAEALKGLGRLSLNGLHGLSQQVAKALALARHRRLDLNGVQQLTPKIAAAFSGHGPASILSLKGLSSLDTESATHLARISSRELRLNHQIHLESDAAEALASTQATIALSTLPAEKSDAQLLFAKHTGTLRITATTLPAAVQAALADHPGPVELPRLTTLESGKLAMKLSHDFFERRGRSPTNPFTGELLPSMATVKLQQLLPSARFVSAEAAGVAADSRLCLKGTLVRSATDNPPPEVDGT